MKKTMIVIAIQMNIKINVTSFCDDENQKETEKDKVDGDDKEKQTFALLIIDFDGGI